MAGTSEHSRRPHSVAVDLLLAAHPLPTATVTVLATGLAVALRTPAPTWSLLAAAVLTGQLSVGWLNDMLDADRDRVAGRQDKPIARGHITTRAVRWAIGAAAALCVGLSVALGPAPAAAHLVAVAAAWGYNLGLKSTVWSGAPYAVAFGLLPVTAWLVSPAEGLPPWWLITAAALLGVAAHGANVLPDLAADRMTGVRGLPQRLPERTVRIGTAGLLLAGLTLLTLGPDGAPSWWQLAVLAAGAALAVVAARGRGRVLSFPLPFVAVIAIAALALIMMFGTLPR